MIAKVLELLAVFALGAVAGSGAVGAAGPAWWSTARFRLELRARRLRRRARRKTAQLRARLTGPRPDGAGLIRAPGGPSPPIVPARQVEAESARRTPPPVETEAARETAPATAEAGAVPPAPRHAVTRPRQHRQPWTTAELPALPPEPQSGPASAWDPGDGLDPWPPARVTPLVAAHFAAQDVI